MSSLPALPARNPPWSHSIYQATRSLNDIYTAVHSALASGIHDPHRLQLHSQAIIEKAFPLLFAMEEALEDEGIPGDWLHSCAEHFGVLIPQLSAAESMAQGR